MKIEKVSFQSIDWSAVPATEVAGETGKAIRKVFEQGNLRVRLVEYTAGYKADHWCTRGHVIHVLEGTLITELDDGREVVTPAGCTYVVQDDGEAHRSRTDTGVKLFVVD